MPLRYTSSAVSSGRTKQRYWSGPSAATSNLWLMVRTLSGWPPSHPFGNAGSVGLSLASPSGAPALAQSPNQRDLLFGEPPLVGERSVAGLSLPGRHHALLGDDGQQAGLLGGIRVRQQRKWRDLAGAVTGRAVLIQNRSDIFIERRRGGVGAAARPPEIRDTDCEAISCRCSSNVRW